MELANLRTVELFQKDGSPSARKLFVLWNPVLRPKTVSNKALFAMDNDQLPDESSNFVRSAQSWMFHTFLQKWFSMVFAALHLTLDSSRDSPASTGFRMCILWCLHCRGKDKNRVHYLVGKICGVAATNALELGIDVGEIDVTLHLGYPGSIASLWQQAGRGGRRGRPSLAIFC